MMAADLLMAGERVDPVGLGEVLAEESTNGGRSWSESTMGRRSALLLLSSTRGRGGRYAPVAIYGEVAVVGCRRSSASASSQALGDRFN